MCLWSWLFHTLHLLWAQAVQLADYFSSTNSSFVISTTCGPHCLLWKIQSPRLLCSVKFRRYWKLGRIISLVQCVFPLLLCALIFSGLLEPSSILFSWFSFFWFSFPDFSCPADFPPSPCQPTAVHHQTSCDRAQWIWEVQTLHWWVLLGAGCCRARNGLMESWIWKWIWAFRWVLWHVRWQVIVLALQQFAYMLFLWLPSSGPAFGILYVLINDGWSPTFSAALILLKRRFLYLKQKYEITTLCIFVQSKAC